MEMFMFYLGYMTYGMCWMIHVKMSFPTLTNDSEQSLPSCGITFGTPSASRATPRSSSLG
eukprot:2054303-Pleurochrysis_carterae.AAC.1